ncbi:MAG: Hsp70 family protein, partial [Planctomycetota bacterium]|nr:Hsp70 family protein [Planctomycetota bacterium]
QGERKMAADNKTIGRFHLDGIPPAPRGVPQVEVTFDIDANGILHVSAKDLGTGKEQKITITASSGLNKDEVDKMGKDAAAHEADDKKRRESVEIRNQADNAAYATEKFIKESGDKMSGDAKAKIEATLAKLRETLKGSDTDAIKSAMDSLNTEMQAMSSELYAKARQAKGGAAGAGAGAGAAGGPAAEGEAAGKKPEGDVIDADFTEKK